MRAAAPLVALAAGLLACGQYGDEAEHPLPSRDAGTADVAVVDGGGPSAVDGGPEASTRFCDANRSAFRCLDFDDGPARPFGFDQVLAGPTAFSVAASPLLGGSKGLVVDTSAIAAYALLDDVPQTGVKFGYELDVVFEELSGKPLVAGVLAAGDGCALSLGVTASSGANGDVALSVKEGVTFATAKAKAPLHLVISSSPPPGPGRKIAIQVTATAAGLNDAVTLEVDLPTSCVRFSALLGASGAFTGSAKATFDNVVVR